MTIVYNFASREWPYKFFNCLDNIIKNAKHPDYFILCKFDEDDVLMNCQPVRDKIQNEYGDKVIVVWGASQNKIDAINRGFEYAPHWDILCNHSDDMWFTKEGFDLDILNAFENFSGIVHFPDQVAGQRLITYAMMDRVYYEENGYVYHPDFISVYADNFQQEQAVIKNRYKYVDKHILEHRHAIWGFGGKDALLERTENPINYAKDQQTFERLRKTIIA